MTEVNQVDDVMIPKDWLNDADTAHHEIEEEDGVAGAGEEDHQEKEVDHDQPIITKEGEGAQQQRSNNNNEATTTR